MNELTPRAIVAQKKQTILSVPKNREYNGNNFLNSFMLAVEENEHLQNAILDPKSRVDVINSLKRAASNGLSLNPQDGMAGIHAYFSKKKKRYVTSYQIYKNGMIQLAMETGKVIFLDADTVYEGDFFEIEKTINGDVYKHIPALKERGEIAGYYSGIKLDNGLTKVTWMTADQMKNHSQRYAASLEPGSAWEKSFEGMGKKTVLKLLLRNIHLPKIKEAVTLDDQCEQELIEIEVEMPQANTKKETGNSPHQLPEKIAQESKKESKKNQGMPF